MSFLLAYTLLPKNLTTQIRLLLAFLYQILVIISFLCMVGVLIGDSSHSGCFSKTSVILLACALSVSCVGPLLRVFQIASSSTGICDSLVIIASSVSISFLVIVLTVLSIGLDSILLSERSFVSFKA